MSRRISEDLTDQTLGVGKKSSDPQMNWRIFGNKIRRLSGVLLFQTIRSVLRAMRLLNDEIEGKKAISLEERIKLFKLLDENDEIVNFLSQGDEGKKLQLILFIKKLKLSKRRKSF